MVRSDTKSFWTTQKKTMTTLHVLAFLDFSKPIMVETYASYTTVGADLMQVAHPLPFFGKKLPLICKKLQHS